MQSAMNRLSGFVRTRRKLVFGIWIGLLLVSVPFASQQTKHLSGGGFEVPGRRLGPGRQGDRPLQGPEHRAARHRAAGARAATSARPIDRVQAAAAEVDHVELTP